MAYYRRLDKSMALDDSQQAGSIAEVDEQSNSIIVPSSQFGHAARDIAADQRSEGSKVRFSDGGSVAGSNLSPVKTSDGFAVPQLQRARSKRHFGNKTRGMKLSGNLGTSLMPPRKARAALENEIGFMASLP